MNNPDHISESLESIFWVKKTLILLCRSGSGIFFTLDPGYEMKIFGSKLQETGSGINIPAPQHWFALLYACMQYGTFSIGCSRQ
jgi:hypothetical protein